MKHEDRFGNDLKIGDIIFISHKVMGTHYSEKSSIITAISEFIYNKQYFVILTSKGYYVYPSECVRIFSA